MGFVLAKNIETSHELHQVLKSETGSPERVELSLIILLLHPIKDLLAHCIVIIVICTSSTVKHSIEVV